MASWYAFVTRELLKLLSPQANIFLCSFIYSGRQPVLFVVKCRLSRKRGASSVFGFLTLGFFVVVALVSCLCEGKAGEIWARQFFVFVMMREDHFLVLSEIKCPTGFDGFQLFGKFNSRLKTKQDRCEPLRL